MKSAKDFAKAWGINQCSAGKRLSGKIGKGKYVLTPVKKVGAVLMYTDDDFERLTGVTGLKVDLTGLICPSEVGEILGIKTKSAYEWLKRSGFKPVLKDCGVGYYKKSEVDKAVAEYGKPVPKTRKPRGEGSKAEPKECAFSLKNLNRFSIFNHRVSVLYNGKWIVKRFALRDGDCLKLVAELLQRGEDILIRSM